MAKILIISDQEKEIIKKLLQSARPRDRLPYTDEFTELKRRFEVQSDRKLTESEFWIALDRVGKKGVPRKKQPRVTSPKISALHKLEIRRLLPEGLGGRDRLPYTSEFDELFRRFSELTNTRLSKAEFWRIVKTVAKSKRKTKAPFISIPQGNLPKRIVDVLEKNNPWWIGNRQKSTHSFRRWAYDEICQRMSQHIAPSVLMSGPRRVGKSVILEQVIERLLLLNEINPLQILRVQFDDLPLIGALEMPIFSIIQWYERQVLQKTINDSAAHGEKIYLFFDEIQNIKGWAPEFKTVTDHLSEDGFFALVTGSSSLRIRRDQDCLAGRVTSIDLGPLRLQEIAGIRGYKTIPSFPNSQDLKNWTDRVFWLDLIEYGKKYATLREKIFADFSRLGGFPICHNQKEEEEADLPEFIIDTVIERTINYDMPSLRPGRTLNREVLRQVFRQICLATGQTKKIEKIRMEVNDYYQSSVSPNEVTDAMHFFEESLLSCMIPPFAPRKQTYGEKICLCDHFIRRAWLQQAIPLVPNQLINLDESYSASAGQIIEGIIGYYLKAIPRVEIAWYPERKNEPEVDFVMTIGTKHLPIEVKYTRSFPKNGQLNGLKSFCGQKRFDAPFGIAITQEYAGPIGDSIIAVPASTFLMLL